jgi:hypothetical protein
VPVAGGAVVATTRVNFPPDAATVNLAIPPSVIAAMAPGASLSFFARVTSDALAAGSTCTANALSRQITFTKAGSAIATSVPTLGTLGLVLLAGIMGVAAHRNRRVRSALNVLLPVIAIAALSLGSAPSRNAQATDPNTTYAGSVNDAIQSVRAVVDAAGNVGVTGTRANNCVSSALPALPVALPDILIGDGGGSRLTVTVNMPTILDAFGTQILYSVGGLPATDGAGQPATWAVTQNGSTLTLFSTLFFGQGASNAVTTYILSVTSPSATGATKVNLKIQTN